MECTVQLVSGRKLEHGACISIVRILAVTLNPLLARLAAKIILVFTRLPTRSSAAPRMISQQHSGGLEVICEDHDLNHRINIPVDSPKTLIVVAIFVYRKEELVNDPTQKWAKKQKGVLKHFENHACVSFD